MFKLTNQKRFVICWSVLTMACFILSSTPCWVRKHAFTSTSTTGCREFKWWGDLRRGSTIKGAPSTKSEVCTHRGLFHSHQLLTLRSKWNENWEITYKPPPRKRSHRSPKVKGKFAECHSRLSSTPTSVKATTCTRFALASKSAGVIWIKFKQHYSK